MKAREPEAHHAAERCTWRGGCGQTTTQPVSLLRILAPSLSAMRSHWVLSWKVLGSSSHFKKLHGSRKEQEEWPRNQLETSLDKVSWWLVLWRCHQRKRKEVGEGRDREGCTRHLHLGGTGSGGG